MCSSTGATRLGVDTSAAYLGWQALPAEPSLVVRASAPSRNNPVRGGLRPEPPKTPPEQMAKVSRFMGDGEVTLL
jgi:hypothetical protein